MPYMDVVSDFNRDFTEILRADLRYWQSEIQGMSDEAIQIGYFELLHRMIEAVPRQVLFSRQFKCPSECRTGLDLLVRKLRSGESVFPHLSRKIQKFNKHDKLLNEWGIQHLHLGTRYRQDGLIEGGKLILFGIFTHTHAYLIDIRGHAWFERDLLEIVRTNWPRLLAGCELKHCLPARTQPSLEEMKNMRDHNVNAPLVLGDGKLYGPPGGGLMTSGVSMRAMQQLMVTKEHLRTFARSASHDPRPLLASFFPGFQRRPSVLRLKLVAYGNYYFCAAEGSNVLNSVWPLFPVKPERPELNMLRRIRAESDWANFSL